MKCLFIIFFSSSLPISNERQEGIGGDHQEVFCWSEESTIQLILLQTKYKNIKDKKKSVINQMIAEELKPWVG